MRWCGGDRTELRVAKSRTGQHRWRVDADVVELVTVLAPGKCPTRQSLPFSTGPARPLAVATAGQSRGSATLRNHRGIAPYRDSERVERGEVTLGEAADRLNVGEATVRRMIAEKLLPAQQLSKGAPWVIRRADLETETIRRAADDRRHRRPPSQDERQNSLILQ